MAKDSVETLTDELVAWAERPENEVGGDAAEAEMLLRYLSDYVGVTDLRKLRSDDLHELLLRVYPRKVTVQSKEDLVDTMPTVRDILDFVESTGRQSKSQVRQLRTAVDGIEPQFADEVMNPENWGMARSATQAMLRDGVNLGDSNSVDGWMTRYNESSVPGLPGSLPNAGGSSGLADSPFDLDDTSLGLDPDMIEALGLPETLPPMRLPSESELAAAARESRLLRRLRELIEWMGDGRGVNDEDELQPVDAMEAAEALGIPVPLRRNDDGALPDMPERPAASSMRKLPELLHLWRIAEDAGLFYVCTDHVHVDEDNEEWDDDEGILDIWASVLTAVNTETLPAHAELHQRDELRLAGMGALVALMLFLARDEGADKADFSEMVRGISTDHLSPAKAGKAWRLWSKHGDPVQTLLDRLVEHGAVRTDDEKAWLTPLGLWAMRSQLEELGLETPLLPRTEEMTAEDLVRGAAGLSEEDLSTESSAWAALRSPEQAVDELLAVASIGSAGERMIATSIALQVGQVAEQRWWRALEQVELRPYAKMALAAIAGADPAEPDDVPAGLRPEATDVAWMLTDMLAAMDDEMGADDVVSHLDETVPSGQEHQIFEVMWRLPHPDVHSVLSRLGTLHPDKKIAKLARKAAFKAGSRA